MIRCRIEQCLSHAFTLATFRRGVLSTSQGRLFPNSSSELISMSLIRNPLHKTVTTATASGSNPFGGTTYPCTSHSGAESDSDRDYYSSGEDAFALEEMCERALEAAIPHVPTLGWSRSALEAGCIDLDLPPGLHSTAMPHGPVNLVLYFYESRNHRLADILAKWRKEEPGPDGKNYEIAKANSFGFEAPPPFKTKNETDAFLRRAVEHRLRANDEVHPQWCQAMGLLGLPQNIPAAIGLEAQLVDEILAQAGDRSVDMNWYVKRLGLAYVYKLTELFYIQDTSPDHQETWEFLDRRIRDLRSMKEAKNNNLKVRDQWDAIGIHWMVE